MLEHAGLSYSQKEPSDIPADSYPGFAVPATTIDGDTFHQRVAVQFALAKSCNLIPESFLDQAKAVQFELNINDAMSERKTRGQKFLDLIEKTLAFNKTGYAVGDKLSYVDFSLYNLVRFYELGDYGFVYGDFLKAHKARIEALPNIAKWLEANQGVAALPPQFV